MKRRLARVPGGRRGHDIRALLGAAGGGALDRGRAAVSLLIFAIAGCSTTTAIRPQDLGSLDGFDQHASPAPRQVETLAGGKVTFDSGSYLYLDLPGGAEGGDFATIQARDGVFDGRTTRGGHLRVPIDQVTGARVEQPRPGVTLVVILVATVLAVGAGVVFARESTHTVPGRALRLGRRIVTARPIASAGWTGAGRDPDVSSLSHAAREELAAAWAAHAAFEHASVPSFARLSMTLVALGAPAGLVEAAHRAALDEVRHAQLAFRLAAAYAGRPVAPGPLPDLQRASAVTARTVAALAAETVLDGCLNEGVAAAAAQTAWQRARDPVVREALDVMARDEAGHAQLAWDVVSWCCEQAGGDLSSRLAALVRRAPAPVGRSFPAALEPQLEAHGCVGAAVWRELGAAARARIAARLASSAASSAGPRPYST
jgi:hypothetical protein